MLSFCFQALCRLRLHSAQKTVYFSINLPCKILYFSLIYSIILYRIIKKHGTEAAMLSFFSSKKHKAGTDLPLSFDSKTQKPVLRCSICTGEQVAGFKNLNTGKFEEVMLIKNEKDLTNFMNRCGISEISKEY